MITCSIGEALRGRVPSLAGAFLAAVLVVSACTPAPPAATPTQPAKPAAPPAAASPETPRPAPSGSPAPSASPAGPAASPAVPLGVRADWQAEWDRWVAGAKQEGKIAISSNPGDIYRQLVSTFQQEYPGIEIEFSGSFGAEFYPKFYTERDAGLYLWDVRIGGPAGDAFEARDRGALEPIRPVLLLPEVADETKWFAGFDGLFFDKDKQYVPGFYNYLSRGVSVNRDLVPASEFKSVKELLDPKWRGKITMQDPRQASGLARVAIWIKLFGEDFVKDLLTKQEVVLTKDARQQAEWVIRGRYPIGVAVSDGAMATFRQEGVGSNVVEVNDEAEASVSTGAGGLQFFNRAPHPNAARVFVNWMLSKDVQARLSKAAELNTRRLDVPAVSPAAAPNPARARDYVANQREDFVPVRDRALEIMREILGN